jgi:glycosyltransferase involved in cell wall biosynthesis
MIKQEIKLSIIIPMHNVAPYVARCLKSLANQDIPFADYEIICINDGSPDNCSEIVRELQKRIPNIILLEQENKGVSVARNNGIAIAKGKYLVMIDPDDYVEVNSFKKILEYAYHDDLDVFVLGYRFLNDDNSTRINVTYIENANKVYNGCTSYFICLGNGLTDPNRLFAMLFKNEFFKNNDLSYLPNVPYLEDGELMVRIMALAQKCGFDDKIFYYRTTRAGSATNSNIVYSDKAINGFFLSAKNLIKFKENKCQTESQIHLLNHGIVKYVTTPINVILSTYNSYSKALALYKYAKKHIAAKLDLDGCNRTNQIFGKGYNHSFLLFLFLREYYYLIERLKFYKARLKS